MSDTTISGNTTQSGESSTLVAAKAAKAAAAFLAIAGTDAKNKALRCIKEEIDGRRAEWLEANAKDVAAAEASGMTKAMLDRLSLTDARIDGILKGIEEIIEFADPIGDVISEDTRPNGLVIAKKRVPLGLIAIIYEARPNVTVDAAVLTLKSGNSVILRGGKEAIRSNMTVVGIMQDALELAGLPRASVSLVTDTSRESADELMHMNEYVDVLIPRGGRGLIRAVTKNSSVPVIRTGEGVCHIYIDKEADLALGAKVLHNAKCSRPSVCNAVECVVIHRSVLSAFLNEALPLLLKHDVQLRCDEDSYAAVKALSYNDGLLTHAEEIDWDSEYDDYILAVKTVDSCEDAVDFISAHTTGHSEAIITKDNEAAEYFLNVIDAAAVYLNASTRFTDGGEFGLGAEIGISTQKMHARGPMGMNELTSYKFIVKGDGQVR